MGKVIVKINLTNLKDTFLKTAGARKAKPRAAQVEALVDTGATRLYLKPSVIKKLGLGTNGHRAFPDTPTATSSATNTSRCGLN